MVRYETTYRFPAYEKNVTSFPTDVIRPETKKPLQPMTLLIKQTNVGFIVFYHIHVFPCKEHRGQLSEVFNHQLPQKLGADVAQNLLATTSTYYFTVHSPNTCIYPFAA